MAHARKRAEERFGLSLSSADTRFIIEMIQSGEARHIEKQSNRLSVFAVPYGIRTLFAVYDRQRKTVVTFLTEEMVKGQGDDEA